jgi:N-acetylglutamate synthase-like GNAT family acetyltransferase
VLCPGGWALFEGPVYQEATAAEVASGQRSGPGHRLLRLELSGAENWLFCHDESSLRDVAHEAGIPEATAYTGSWAGRERLFLRFERCGEGGGSRSRRGKRVQIEIREERELPGQITRLVEIGLAEDFEFVGRFVAEWEAGRNRFDQPGEVCLFAYLEGILVGFGGLNLDPYQDEPSIGRVRRVYVEPAARGGGVGGALVRELVRRARPAFATLRLATEDAAAFFEHLGFARVSEHKATHKLSLDTVSTV